MKAIDTFLKDIREMVPQEQIKLNEAATTKDFETLKEKLNISKLPENFTDLYSKFNGEGFMSAGIVGNWHFLKIDNIIKECCLMEKLVKKGTFKDVPPYKSKFVKNYWWNDKWIPFISSGSGHLICLDMDPAEKGTIGQVILFMHDNEKRPLLAKNIDSWLQAISADIKRGLYKYSDMGFSNEAFVKSSIEAKEIYR